MVKYSASVYTINLFPIAIKIVNYFIFWRFLEIESRVRNTHLLDFFLPQGLDPAPFDFLSVLLPTYN